MLFGNSMCTFHFSVILNQTTLFGLVVPSLVMQVGRNQSNTLLGTGYVGYTKGSGIRDKYKDKN